MRTYAYTTEEATYDFYPNFDNPNVINVYTKSAPDLQHIIDSLELSGTEDGRYAEDLEVIYTEELPGQAYEAYLELTKADLAIYLQFEALNYIGAVSDITL